MVYCLYRLALKFNDLVGRTMQNSIYKKPQGNEVDITYGSMTGFKNLSHVKR